MLDSFVTWFFYCMAFLLGNALGYYQEINVAEQINTSIIPAISQVVQSLWNKLQYQWVFKVKPYMIDKKPLIKEKISYYEQQR